MRRGTPAPADHPMLRPKGQSPSVRPVDFSAEGGRRVGESRAPKKRDFSSAVNAAVEDAAARRARRGDPKAWEGATEATLVGLYAVLHHATYAVWPEELKGEFLQARSSAGRMARELGSVERAVALLLWKWASEKRRVAEKGPGDFRIGWKLQFSTRLVTDFKVARPSK